MKLLKSLLAGMLVVGFAAAASAQTEVYIAGSTAYRGATVKAIEQVLSGASSSGTFSYAYVGSSAYGATFAIFSGTYNSNWTIVHTHWTGSVAGTVDESVPNQISFIDDAVVTSGSTAGMVPPADGLSGTNAFGGGVALTTFPTSNHFVNVAMSDSFNTSVGKAVATEKANAYTTANGSTYQADITSANLKQAGTLSESVVGVLPFVWVAGAQSTGTAPFTNMTQESASQLVTTGFVPVECLTTATGNALAGDETDYAFLIGRNEDSGTRVCAEAEAQVGSSLGKLSFGLPTVQWACLFTGTTNGGTGNNLINTDGNYGTGVTVGGSNLIETGGTGCTLSDIGEWPANAPLNTETVLNWGIQGHSGQIGGGDVGNVLKAENPLYLNITAVDGGGNAPDNWDPAGNGNAVDQSNKAYLVGYLGCSDASGIPGVFPVAQGGKAAGTAANGNPPAELLTYNGVNYDPANIQNGSYDFWSFEHMYYNTTLANSINNTNGAFAAPKAFVDKVCDTLYNGVCQTNSSGVTDVSTVPNVAVAGLKFTNVAYSRGAEGYPITPNF